MFVLCVLYNKDKRQKPGQSGLRSTDKVQREKESRRGHGFLCSVCCVARTKGKKAMTIRTKNQVRIKYKVRTKKNSAEARFFAPVQTNPKKLVPVFFPGGKVAGTWR
jgi:hypothetical protein